MSENTVRKYIRQLEEQELLFTEPTEIMTRAGQKRNRNLHHTLRPTQESCKQKSIAEMKKVPQNLHS